MLCLLRCSYNRNGPRLTVSDKLYHPDCFVCKQCRKPFPTHQFMIKDGDAYHPKCLPVEAAVTVACAKCHHDIGCVVFVMMRDGACVICLLTVCDL